MKKQKKITWEEMKKSFPNEWLMIVNYKEDKLGCVISGIVKRHSKEKTKVFIPPTPDTDSAYRYTGTSTFPGGLRSSAYRHEL